MAILDIAVRPVWAPCPVLQDLALTDTTTRGNLHHTVDSFSTQLSSARPNSTARNYTPQPSPLKSVRPFSLLPTLASLQLIAASIRPLDTRPCTSYDKGSSASTCPPVSSAHALAITVRQRSLVSVWWVTSSPIQRHRESSWCELSEGISARNGMQTDGAQVGIKSHPSEHRADESKRNLLRRLFLKRHLSRAMRSPVVR